MFIVSNSLENDISAVEKFLILTALVKTRAKVIVFLSRTVCNAHKHCKLIIKHHENEVVSRFV